MMIYLLVMVVVTILANWMWLRIIRRSQSRPLAMPPADSDSASAGQGETLADAGTAEATLGAPPPLSRVFRINGLSPTSPGAAQSLERRLRSVEGVTGAYGSPVTAFAYVDYDESQVSEAELVRAVQGGGYQVGDARVRLPTRRPKE